MSEQDATMEANLAVRDRKVSFFIQKIFLHSKNQVSFFIQKISSTGSKRGAQVDAFRTSFYGTDENGDDLYEIEYSHPSEAVVEDLCQATSNLLDIANSNINDGPFIEGQPAMQAQPCFMNEGRAKPCCSSTNVTSNCLDCSRHNTLPFSMRISFSEGPTISVPVSMLCYDAGRYCCLVNSSQLPSFALSNADAHLVLDSTSECSLDGLQYQNGFPALPSLVTDGRCLTPSHLLISLERGITTGAENGLRFVASNGDECYFFSCTDGTCQYACKTSTTTCNVAGKKKRAGGSASITLISALVGTE